ncbi:peptidoglycan endopeptidase [Flavobacterium humi]|uniref:Peptidoglycan endopeptidase n=2 Tax=Flavobacterium humi TaxID=2562683 RepID=A0A4Z0L748_9FLAO|nr:peptidoglycan endopeptidase [Flavobacterium humi]
MPTIIFSQEKIKHTVTKGESVYSIAKKYQVKPSEIIDLNPKAKKTLKLNTVLLVPNKGYKPEENTVSSTPVIHEVLAKETLYGISKKYKVSIDKIKQANPAIETEGLKLGSKITIPGTLEAVATVVEVADAVENTTASGEEIVHKVLPKETKYKISKQYKVSIAELERLNPEIVKGLPVGYELIIRQGTKKETAPVVAPQIEEEEEEGEEVIATSSSQIKVLEIKESSENTPVAEVAPLSPENMTKADFLIAKASENLGARYRSGATGNGGFDCSGLMFATFKNIEMTLPRSSHEMAAGAGVKISRSQAQKGDLIFFATMGRGRVSHVGMITEVTETEIKFIHSSTSAGVIISSVNEPYYAKRFVQVNRVLNN